MLKLITVNSIEDGTLIDGVTLDTERGVGNTFTINNNEQGEFTLEGLNLSNLENDDILSLMSNDLFAKSDRPKFWGWTCGPVITLSLTASADDGFRTCCYRVLGAVATCGQYDPDDLPGSNPRIND